MARKPCPPVCPWLSKACGTSPWLMHNPRVHFWMAWAWSHRRGLCPVEGAGRREAGSERVVERR